MKQLVKRLLLGVAAFAVIGFVIGALANARSVATVTVTLLDGREEPHDVVLPGMAKGGAAPDLRLLLRTEDEWVDCGTFQDTRMGSGLTWHVPKTVPAKTLAEYKLVEVDKGLDDVVDQVPAGDNDSPVAGHTCRFTHTRQFDLTAGCIWFIEHPIGQIIAIAFGAALGLYIFALLAA